MSPWLIRCALVMMRLLAACRNTSVRRTTGTTPLSIRSRNTSPGPTEGNWSTSPTSSRLPWAGTARSRWLISGTSTIEVSSTTSKSQSKGRLSLRVNAARAGLDFEQAVNRLGLQAGRFGEPLGRAAGRGAQ